jgi:hypothetical protein
MSDGEKRFPVLIPFRKGREYADLPRSIPWAAIAPHGERAVKNHDQTLERLASRGGLSPVEILMVMTERPWLVSLTGDIAALEAEAAALLRSLT